MHINSAQFDVISQVRKLLFTVRKCSLCIIPIKGMLMSCLTIPDYLLIRKETCSYN